MFVSTVVHAFRAFNCIAGRAAHRRRGTHAAEAERLALEQAPTLARPRANVSASAERTVYEGRLPAPQLTTGFVNVPTDSYNLRQDDMTMTMVGVRKASRPATRSTSKAGARAELTREEARLEAERRNLLEAGAPDLDSRSITSTTRCACSGKRAAFSRSNSRPRRAATARPPTCNRR